MHSSRSHTIHIRAKVNLPRSRKSRISDALRVQPKPRLLGIVLSCWERARDDLGLEPVSKAGEVLVRIVVAGWLAGHGICVVEDLLEVFDGGSLFDWGCRHCGWKYDSELKSGFDECYYVL